MVENTFQSWSALTAVTTMNKSSVRIHVCVRSEFENWLQEYDKKHVKTILGNDDLIIKQTCTANMEHDNVLCCSALVIKAIPHIKDNSAPRNRLQ